LPSRREQIQSYQYLMQRVVNAFVVGDTDPAQPPLRRWAGAGFASIMVTALALAAVGVYGLVKHGGNTTWRSESAVIIEKETGTRYVYRGKVLYPVANYVSALLVLGGPGQTVSVSRESLVGVARGPLIGIAGAPDALPPASRALGAPWSLCSQSGQDQSGAPTATSRLVVGRGAGSGTGLGSGALLVSDPTTKKVYLLSNGHRYQAPNTTVLRALGVDQQPRLLVDAGWLDAVPLGQSLSPIIAENRGKPSTALSGALIGQVFAVTSGDRTQYYLARADDLLPVTALEQALILADPGTAAAYPGGGPAPRAATTAQLAGAKIATRAERTDASPPEQPPTMAPADATLALCAVFANAGSGPEVVYGVSRFAESAGIATFGLSGGTGSGGTSSPVVDRVLVAPGYFTVVRATSGVDSSVTGLYLVTDQGRRYQLTEPQELTWLGYGQVTPVTLPNSVVARIPLGPTLDPAAAARPVPPA